MADFQILSAISGSGGQWLALLVFIEVIFVVAILCFIGWLMYPIYAYPYICPITKIRNGVLKDGGNAYAKLIKKNGKEKLLIWRLRLPFPLKQYIEPPPNEYKIVFNRKRDKIHLFEDNGGNFRPMYLQDIDGDSPVWSPDEKDINFWAATEIEQAVKDYEKKNALLEWIPTIASAVFLVFIFVFMLILSKELAEVARALSDVAGALTSVFPK